jgi:hypothetical protein
MKVKRQEGDIRTNYKPKTAYDDKQNKIEKKKAPAHHTDHNSTPIFTLPI